jgi:hypothetical protein
MWITLTLVVLASTAPTPPPEGIAIGSRVRLSAGPRVEVPGLFSGTAKTHSSRPYEKERGLLVFRGADGGREAVIAPGTRVEGVLAGAEPGWLHLRRSEGEPPYRVALASVARVEVLVARRRAAREGAAVGFGVGAAAGIGWAYMLSGPEGSDSPRSFAGFAVSAAVLGAGGAGVGALLGLLGTKDDWRVVPRDALPGQPVARVEGPAKDRALVHEPDGPGPLRRAMAELSAIAPRP